jgi:glycosyltransferase involved in cell wall biosynthesis
MSTAYPKVLIIGQYFHKKSGGGITLTNLFYGWSKNNIAVAACEMNNPDFSVCEKFYCIGDKEIKRGFPFNLKFNEEQLESGIIQSTNGQEGSATNIYGTHSILGKLKDKLLFITGQIHRRRRFVVSNAFSEWLNEFSPDIIYSQLSSLELIRFISKLQADLKKPLVVHMMDDWPMTITNTQKGIFRIYWDYIIKRELKQLIRKADVLMSISESMSDEYMLRYGRKFLPFHNPIDVKRWSSERKKDYSRKENFKILYAGRIGAGLQNCLFEIALAIKDQINSGLKIEFIIQSTSNNRVLAELVKFDFVILKSPVLYNQLPGIFSDADLLVLPNDFDKSSISFLKYSMPTKASEYMVSGTPILVYSSSETAVTKHALKYGWAYVVSENSNEKLGMGIKKLYEDQDLRMDLGCRAKEFAIKNYNSEAIRENFKKAILNQLLVN